MSSADVVILGGGVAGFATAGLLRAAGVKSVCVVERESLYASQASARNAAIFLPVERDATTTALVMRQAEMLHELFAYADEDWLSRTGALLVSNSEAAALALYEDVLVNGLPCEYADRAAIIERVPALEAGDVLAGISVPESGVLNTHAMITLLIERSRRSNVTMMNDVKEARVRREGGRVLGITLADGTRIDAPSVVVASGAWSGEVGRDCDAPLPLTPLKRHLMWLRGNTPEDLKWPVVWSLEDEVYFRPESGGILASPCDERPGVASVDPLEDADAKDALARKLTRLAPSLIERGVRRSWACLRTYADDRLPVLGRDPRVEGLAWLAGLGGQGMSVCLAAAEVTVASMLDTEHDLRRACEPSRFFARTEKA